jgi:hypothetical protein
MRGRNRDPDIWDESTVLRAEQTRVARVHVTLRLDADLYRQVLAYKRKNKRRTVTAAIEDLLGRALSPNAATREDLVRAAGVLRKLSDADVSLLLLPSEPPHARRKKGRTRK